MQVYKEVDAADLKYRDQLWSGARDTVKYLTLEEVEHVLSWLEDIAVSDPDHPFSETELNDFFWFETEVIADWLDFESFDEIMKRGEQ